MHICPRLSDLFAWEWGRRHAAERGEVEQRVRERRTRAWGSVGVVVCRWWQMERATGVLRASYMSRAVRRRAMGASLRGAGTALMAASASSAGRVRTAAYAWMSWCTAAMLP